MYLLWDASIRLRYYTRVAQKATGISFVLIQVMQPRQTSVCSYRLLHRWLSLVVVVYKVQRYPLSLVSVFGFMGDNQRSLNDRLGSLSNLMLRLLKCPAEDSRFSLTCSTTVKCCYTIRIKYANLRGTKF